MPGVGEIDGITFYVYGDDHNPPHMHVKYAEHKALLVIATGDLYAGSLPVPQLHAARDWLAANRERIAEAWRRLNPGARP